MPRQKISEFKAKQLIFSAIGKNYEGMGIDLKTKSGTNQLQNLDDSRTYVVKVDQGIKKRGKRGLVSINVSSKNVEHEVTKLASKGYSSFLVEEFFPHEDNEERYFALIRTRHGMEVFYNPKGGVDIESAEARASLQKFGVKTIKNLPLPLNHIMTIIDACDTYHISYLEINPLVVRNNRLHILDLAVEVDSAGAYFTHEAWEAEDFADAKSSTQEEIAVERLALTSPASFKLHVLNPNGSIFMLLSGGGASLVLADEYYNRGYGAQIANYGEYSGAPTTEETYEYTKQVLSALLKSTAHDKVLLIAGGVANFTDISITFRGIVRALDEISTELKKQKIGIYIRRGGPNQESGLRLMREFLKTHALKGSVYGPDMSLPEIVDISLQDISLKDRSFNHLKHV
jgi:ATP citrate (pro-S)-lyase